MNPIRSLATGLLFLTGVLHLLSIALVKFEPVSIITIVFGAAYLLIGFLLARRVKSTLWLGAIVPLVGLVLAVLGMLMKPTLLGGVFIVIDIAVSACCFYLIFRK